MIRFATIGTSSITARFAAAAREAGGVEVRTVTSRTAESARAFADQIGAPHAVADLQQVWDDPEIDAIYIASPNALHAGQVADALAAGKHVLVEKPAALDADEFAGLAAQAGRNGLVLLENLRSAYDPLTLLIGQRIPELGRLRRIALAYCQRSARYDEVLAGRTVNIFDPALGGGALNDLGIYPIHLLVKLVGEPAQVQAAWTLLPTGADGAGAAIATYDGLVADIAWSKITASRAPSEVQGELGTLVIDHAADLNGARIHWHGGRVEELDPPRAPDNMVHSVAHFAALVAAGQPATAENERTTASLRTLDRIRAAAATTPADTSPTT